MRFGPERDAQVDQPLAAIRQLAALCVLDSFKPEKADQFGSVGMDVAVTVDVAPEIEAAGMPRLQRQSDVLVNRRIAEQAGDLERAGEPLSADVLHGQAVNGTAVEQYRSLLRIVQTRYQVEQRCLPCAVGT